MKENEILKNGGWREKWHEFCLGLAPHYVSKMKSIFSTEDGWAIYNYLGHALDCEAHHDALVELFPTANSTNEK